MEFKDRLKSLRSKKGITLVALVITIIILVILAGISIASLTNSGLFENARLAQRSFQSFYFKKA